MSKDWLRARSPSRFPGLGCKWQAPRPRSRAPISGPTQAPLKAPDPKGAYTWAGVIYIPPLPSYLEQEIATHSSTLAWKIPWMAEPGRLQSMGLQRVGHD